MRIWSACKRTGRRGDQSQDQFNSSSNPAVGEKYIATENWTGVVLWGQAKTVTVYGGALLEEEEPEQA